jgi:hypothetical protein
LQRSVTEMRKSVIWRPNLSRSGINLFRRCWTP